LTYQLRYHPYVKEKDIPKLSRNIQKRIRTVIEKRLLKAPEKYSEPLRRTLKGYRKLRVGDYRIVLKIQGTEILILGISHRKDVYGIIEWRKG
jgi:mRNA interferase RelE/StbE